MNPYIIPFEKLQSKDLEIVGGKNASIGEMISTLSNLGVSVPGGFATTSHAYRDFLAQDALGARIADTLATLDVDDVERLAIVGKQIRGWMLATPFPRRLSEEVLQAWRKWGAARSSPLRCAPRPPRRICLRPLSRGSKRPSSTCVARSTCSRACTRCTRRCSTTGPSPTACTTTSTTTPWHFPWACSTWCAATWAPPA